MWPVRFVLCSKHRLRFPFVAFVCSSIVRSSLSEIRSWVRTHRINSARRGGAAERRSVWLCISMPLVGNRSCIYLVSCVTLPDDTWSTACSSSILHRQKPTKVHTRILAVLAVVVPGMIHTTEQQQSTSMKKMNGYEIICCNILVSLYVVQKKCTAMPLSLV